MMNDWAELCALDGQGAHDVNHMSVRHPAVTQSVVTAQGVEVKEENAICNHKTTVTTDFDKGGDSSCAESYSTCHNQSGDMKARTAEDGDDSRVCYDMLNNSSAGQCAQPEHAFSVRPARDVTWYQESSGDGWDCQFCKHLVSRWEYAENSRRRFRWRCDVGHAVMEYGRDSERILLAPESCHEWERFVPGASKRVHVKEDPRRRL